MLLQSFSTNQMPSVLMQCAAPLYARSTRLPSCKPSNSLSRVLRILTRINAISLNVLSTRQTPKVIQCLSKCSKIASARYTGVTWARLASNKSFQLLFSVSGLVSHKSRSLSKSKSIRSLSLKVYTIYFMKTHHYIASLCKWTSLLTNLRMLFIRSEWVLLMYKLLHQHILQ